MRGEGFITSKSKTNRTTVNKPRTSTKTNKSVKKVSKTNYNFKNCTDLKRVYPKGVSKGHPAYQSKMDRDKDGFACEPSRY